MSDNSIEQVIDNAIEDYGTSEDAMRWSSEPAVLARGPGMTRYRWTNLPGEQQAHMLGLVRSFGLDPKLIAVDFAVTYNDDGYKLHLTEYLRNADGRRFKDIAADRIATRPLVFDVSVDPARSVP